MSLHIILKNDDLKKALAELAYDQLWAPPGSVYLFQKDAQNRAILLWKTGDCEFFIKLFNPSSPEDFEAPYIEWLRLHELRSFGFNTPDPAALIARYDDFSGRLIRAAVVTLRVPGRSLEEWTRSWNGSIPLRVIQALSKTIARFHGLGFRHRDLYFSHLFYEPSEDLIYLLDFQRVYRAKSPASDFYGLLRDLAQLLYSASSFLSPDSYDEFHRVFFHTYFRHPAIPPMPIPQGLVLAFVEIKRRRIARHDGRRAALHSR